MSYRTLEIWQRAREASIQIHRMTLEMLPKFEMYEVGSQIRRSSKSIRSNIVEGYGRRRYKNDYIRFLTYALASCDETTDHIETLFETESLKDRLCFESLQKQLDVLGRKINNFIQSVERQHISVREEGVPYAGKEPEDGISYTSDGSNEDAWQ
jgi:four helix bundle protein